MYTIRHVGRNVIILFGFILLGNTAAFGQQHTIKGLITSDDDIAKAFITVEVYDTSFERLDYIILENQAFFETTIDSIYTQVNLIVSTLGCAPYARTVNFSQDKLVFLAIQLQDCAQTLEEVVITAEQSYIQEQGDTLTFDLEGFRKETDITLGDILGRMPGIEISPNNQIMYQGKRVKQVWVQGRDILNDQHSLALEGLQTEDIAQVQIIHEYRPFHRRFSQEHSGAVAMNIGLTEKAKGRINGDAELLAGIHQKYKLDAEAVVIKSQNGNATFLRSNNIGSPVIQATEYLGFISSFSRLDQSQSGSVSVIPPALLPQPDARVQLQHLLSTSTDFDISEKIRGKVSLLGLFKTTQKAALAETIFFDAPITFDGQVREKSSFPFLLGNFNIKQELSRDLILEIDIPIEINDSKQEETRLGLYNQNSFNSRLYRKQSLYHFSPQLIMSARHNANWSSKHNLWYDTQANPVQIEFSDGISENPTLFQKLHNTHQNLSVSSSFENRQGIFLLKIQNQLDAGSFRTHFDTSSLPYNNHPRHSFQWRYVRPRLQYGIKNQNWITHLELELAHDHITTNDQAYRQTWLNPLFRIKYNWRISKFIGLTLRQQQQFLDQQNAFDLYLLEDNLRLSYNAIEAGLNKRTRQLDLYYFNLQKRSNASVNCSVQFQQSTNALTRFNRFENDFIISEAFLAQQAQSGAFSLAFSFPLFKRKYLLKPNLRSRWSIIERPPYTPLEEQQLNLSSRLVTAWDGAWNAELGLQYNLAQQQQSELKQIWTAWHPSVGIRYHKNKWNADINYAWQFNQIDKVSFDIHQLHFTIEHQLTKRWAISCQGVDVLNLNESEALQLIRTPSFVEQVAFSRLQGALLLGLKYLF